jgi:hypothetical protein
VAFDIFVEAQSRESQAAIDKANAAVRVAEAQAALELGWARLGAVTALERHLNALKNAAIIRKDRPPPLTNELEAAAQQIEAARAEIKSAENALAQARQGLQAATEALGEATRARMTAETEVRKLASG